MYGLTILPYDTTFPGLPNRTSGKNFPDFCTVENGLLILLYLQGCVIQISDRNETVKITQLWRSFRHCWHFRLCFVEILKRYSWQSLGFKAKDGRIDILLFSETSLKWVRNTILLCFKKNIQNNPALEWKKYRCDTHGNFVLNRQRYLGRIKQGGRPYFSLHWNSVYNTLDFVLHLN